VGGGYLQVPCGAFFPPVENLRRKRPGPTEREKAVAGLTAGPTPYCCSGDGSPKVLDRGGRTTAPRPQEHRQPRHATGLNARRAPVMGGKAGVSEPSSAAHKAAWG